MTDTKDLASTWQARVLIASVYDRGEVLQAVLVPTEVVEALESLADLQNHCFELVDVLQGGMATWLLHV